MRSGVERVEWTGGAITLSENATYSEARSYLTSENGVETAEEEQFTGTYTRIGTDLTITSDGFMYPLRLEGRTITEQNGELTLVWRR